jgi:CDP-diacylglycerol--glycerol-3-phosphate 3-phosphatidyltransferase
MATVTPGKSEVRPEPSIFNLPNQLTASRFVLGVVLFALIEWKLWFAYLVTFAVAAATDWLDGYVARRQGLVSSLGRNFDPLVDKVVICGAYIFLLPLREAAGLAAWMVTVVVGRELIITGLRSFLENRGATFGADWLGKVKMTLQCAALFAIFVVLGVPHWPEGGVDHLLGWLPGLTLVRDVLIYAMLVATALSGLQYLYRAVSLLKADPVG